VSKEAANRSSRGAAGSPGRQAVVDIGSNSVRLVIYEGPARAPMPIVNEKALCGLGRDMESGGGLNAEAVDYALATLGRFRRLIEAHDDPPTRVFATAAVREARDGAAFVRRINALGFDAVILDGGEEAMLAALGVVSYEPGATGLVGDMGGGSLELVALKGGEIARAASLSIGPLRLLQQTGGKAQAAGEIAAKALDGVPWLKPGAFDTLYSVGGAWRAIARIHMRLKGYPLSVLHHYELSRSEAIEVCSLVARQSRRSLDEIPGIPKRRADTLPFAALVFRATLEHAEARKVVVSAGGVREGVLYRELSGEQRALDPLIEGARFFAARLAPDPGIGDALTAMTDPLFRDETAAARRIRHAACILADVAAYFHPDLRAGQAFDTALRAPFYGVTHAERVALALALHTRHDGTDPGPDERVLSLLNSAERERALRLGLALRFGAALAPKASRALKGATLAIVGDALVFQAPKALGALMGEFPEKRLEAAAAAFGTRPAVAYF
jgi:exopolyphosphatase/guanosine-5'-triphosphate,3'-diphosphate pyrophosphatase